MPLDWKTLAGLPSRSFSCGHCDLKVASDRGYYAVEHGNTSAWIYICHSCEKPNYFHYNGSQVPSTSWGDPVSSLPQDVDALYREARDCIKVGAFTASVMAARKLLMNIAVSRGAPAGKAFVDYVDFLAKNGCLPPESDEWVDHIRTKGNEANHEIRKMSRAEAEELIDFTSMLLKFIFEYPARMKKKPAKA